jgi:hypothetical protein
MVATTHTSNSDATACDVLRRRGAISGRLGLWSAGARLAYCPAGRMQLERSGWEMRTYLLQLPTLLVARRVAPMLQAQQFLTR